MAKNGVKLPPADEPEEVAAIAVFLAQEINRGITGQAINIDGGGVMS